MGDALNKLRNRLSLLKLDDSLLYLNYLLGVSRQEMSDPQMQLRLDESGQPVPAFVVHFLAKEMIEHSTPVGLHVLDWATFRHLVGLFFELDDPICDDPNWPSADPTGFFVRLLSAQLPPQQQRILREYGLALGLFRDAGMPTELSEYDLRTDLEQELGLSVEQYMAFGFLCRAFRAASIRGQRCPGTLTYQYLSEAFRQGFQVAVPEVWRPFLNRVACTPTRFRSASEQAEYRVTDARFAQFGFNPLHRFPMIEVADGRFVAVDPDLIVERTTWGLFYDLFERDRMKFTVLFGDVFARFVGTLLGSCCPAHSLWSAAEWERVTPQKGRPKSKICDWAYRGNNRTILIECKSLRPTLELTTYGSDSGVQQMASRIAQALAQLSEHDEAIQRCEWKAHGLSPGPTLHVVMTYGRISTVNGPFFRNRIRQELSRRGQLVRPFVVLSLGELDTVVRLVELGEPLDGLVHALSSNDSFDPFVAYKDKLASCMVSNYAMKRGQAFLDRIDPTTSA